MIFVPQIKYNSNLSAEENLMAVINWQNFLLREMTAGRVPQNRDNAKNDNDVLAAAQADTDALVVDHELRLTMVELGVE